MTCVLMKVNSFKKLKIKAIVGVKSKHKNLKFANY